MARQGFGNILDVLNFGLNYDLDGFKPLTTRLWFQ